ncbi:MAG TPA: hypothetical protein DCP07_07310 [Lachnospiraceae bacterium]|nr:hypothetical protein [Lachnospiraceae bacterium]
MEDIIKVKNSSYGRYEELLIRRDNLKKEAFILQRQYVAEFGDLIIEVFEKKLECIKKKKTIEFCQRKLNYGKSIDQDELQAYLDEEMKEFQARLNDMIKDTESAKKREKVSEIDLIKIKKIYHKLVKLIHPDINPLTSENEALYDLWQRIQIAYNCNDLKEMEELEVRVTTTLEQLGVGNLEIEIPNIDDKIAELEKEIVTIMETDPYQYKFILEDPKAVEEKKQSLREELQSYIEYSEQLDNILENLMTDGNSIVWKMS